MIVTVVDELWCEKIKLFTYKTRANNWAWINKKRSEKKSESFFYYFMYCSSGSLYTRFFFFLLNSLWITKKCYLFARNDLFKSTRATWHGRKELLKKCRFIKYSNWFQIVRKENYFYKYVLVKFTIINAPFNMKVNQSTALRIRVF